MQQLLNFLGLAIHELMKLKVDMVL